jgi:hypothetical protein
MDIDVATVMMKEMLHWRKQNWIDEIRQDIVYGGRNNPLKFPKAEIVMKISPQIVITPKARDKFGRPVGKDVCISFLTISKLLLFFVAFEAPNLDVLHSITKEEYLQLLIHVLEYRSLVLEQLSDEMEKQYLRDHPDPNTRKDGYGVVLLYFCIRDLKAVHYAHFSPEIRLVVKAALDIGLNNYPEFLGKNHFINVPWIFYSVWYLAKSFLNEE